MTRSIASIYNINNICITMYQPYIYIYIYMVMSMRGARLINIFGIPKFDYSWTPYYMYMYMREMSR